MRCPKCKFISFDDLSTCAKCSNDLSALVEDLQGTGTEARVAFFLASVVQAQDFEEDDAFSASQATTPLDDSNLSFDDTLSGSTADALGLDLDESIELATDDIAIELGDQMPVDLGELDLSSTGDIDLDATEAFSDTDATLGVDVSTTGADLDEINFDDDIDLNLTGQLTDDSAGDFDATEILSSIDEADTLSDDNIDLDLTGSFSNNNVELDFDEVDLDATGMSLTTDDMATPQAVVEDTSALDLDEDLLAELADDTFLPEETPPVAAATAAVEESIDFDMSAELPALGDDESLDTDITGDFAALDAVGDDESMSSDDIDALLDDFDDELGGLDADDLDDLGDFDTGESETDLSEPTIDFGDLEADDSGSSSPSLDFDDLDVSDLVSSGDDTSVIEIDDSDDEVDLSSLIDETPSTEDDDFDLDMLDEDMPELELTDEDTDDGPPDLP